MYNPDTDLIFPPRAISPLSNERSTAWQELVAGLEISIPESPEQMAFILMMARLNNCATCNADSYRAIHGCMICSRQSLKRFHGSDNDLIQLFEAARTEVGVFLHNECAPEWHK